MRVAARYVASLAFAALAIGLLHTGCGGSGTNSGFSSANGDDGGGDGTTSGSGSGTGGSSGSLTGSSSSGSASGSSSGSGTNCPSGLKCNVSCSGGGTTTISGVVYDPAGKDPIYNVTVFVPAGPLITLPKGVPRGSEMCDCAALFKEGALAATTTAVDGSFKLTNAPVGSSVPLVIQIGKWRRQFTIPVTACQDNPQTGNSISLPSTIPTGNTTDNIPDIAVSTGEADTLECLMKRIGLPDTEYVAGNGTTGHIHVFSGGLQGSGGGAGGVGGTEEPSSMAGAPPSYTSLWDSAADLYDYDIVLLSCEGGETYNANPPALETYLNGGGRVFASHFHYAWFTGPLQQAQNYTANPDWNNLASWTPGSNSSGTGAANGKIVQTLNGSGGPFPKGQALYEWLGLVNALGVMGAPAMELPIDPVRYNAVVSAANTPSQPWVQDDSSNNTLYFSFDTPINAPSPPDGGPPEYCGRAVFSDLHVGGETMPPDNPPPPGGCTSADLSPQEKALEFMLFDLSSCVIPDTEPPTDDAGVPPVFQ
jgi:hypothetical protein